MKKWIIFSLSVLLIGCSEPVSTVYESTTKEEREQLREHMDVKVHVYSLEQNNVGYVIKWDERDKWIITNASVVYQHPKALIETSNNQLLEGEVVYSDTNLNIAVLHFRNSADVLFEEQYNDSVFNFSNGVPTKFISYDKANKPITIEETTISNLTQQVTKEPLSFEERITARKQLESFPEIVVNDENKIDTYEKSTFLFDQDQIHLAANEFFNQYSAFVNGQPSTLLEMIANDRLQTVFYEWEEFGETYTFGEVNITSIQNTNFQYIVRFETKMGSENVEISGTLYFTQINDELFVTSFVFKENK